MRDASLLEFFAGHDETVARVKRHCVRLRIDDRTAMPFFAGQFNEQRQQRGADAATAPWRQYRHPPDMAIRQQTSAADRIRFAIKSKGVRADRVDIIPFERFGNALLDDENGPADGAKRIAIAGPISYSPREFGRRVHA